jgi:hypothetical protein
MQLIFVTVWKTPSEKYKFKEIMAKKIRDPKYGYLCCSKALNVKRRSRIVMSVLRQKWF